MRICRNISGTVVIQAYDKGRCDVFTTDVSGLYADRLKLTAPDEHVVLPDVISKEPLGPIVLQGDSPWFNVVRWIYYDLLNAEELGISQKTAEQMKTSANPEVKRFLGAEGKFGEGIGLSNDWALNIVRHGGNYGEIL
jgi:general L-amino acid transport system substrate-binding protein